MKQFRYYSALIVAATVALPSFAQDAGNTPADNSKTNKMASHISASADAQKNVPTDAALPRRIRQSIVADKNLSTYAHNVKIVAVDGTVTLNGTVRSEAEKRSVQEKAVSVAGQEHVVDQMTVAPPHS